MRLHRNKLPVVLVLVFIAVTCNTNTRAPGPSPGESTASTVSPGLATNPVPLEWFNREIPSTYFGMTLINQENWPDFPISSLGKGTEVNWAYVERTKGVFDWSQLDKWVSSAEAHNADFMFSNDLIPPWAAKDPATCKPTYPGSVVLGCTSMVANLVDWEAFVTALVTRYHGRIRIYELWNEPDQSFSGSMQDMVTLTTAMLRIIRANDQAAIVLSPSATTAAYIDRYWDGGGATTVDAVSLHGYPDDSNPDPEAIIEVAAEYRKAMAKHGLERLPLWDTEGSWGETSRKLVGSESQPAFTARHLLLHWSAGIERFYWYAWDNTGWGTLWTEANGLTASGSAYRRMMEWMNGAVMSGPCHVTGDSTWECTLKHSNDDDTLIVWNPFANKLYEPPTQYQEYCDLNGTLRPVTGPLTVGREPILFSTKKKTPQTSQVRGAKISLAVAIAHRTSSWN